MEQGRKNLFRAHFYIAVLHKGYAPGLGGGEEKQK